MSFVEFEFRIDAQRVDALSDALLEAGALSVGVEDADADSSREQAIYGEPGLQQQRSAWECNRLRVLIARDTSPEQTLAAACAALAMACPGIDAVREVDDADWVGLTQAQFEPIQVGRIWIVPSWREPPDPRALIVRLDPGIAFGTGSHPTTRLCLAWLQSELERGERVLDFGCGSGILAIAAARLGAGLVLGTDIDPQAVEAARSNSQGNRVSARYTVPDDLPTPAAQPFDVIVANILANPLMLLAPSLAGRLAPGGRVVLSGILERQADAVIDCYARVAPDLSLAVWGVDSGWSCVVGRRPD